MSRIAPFAALFAAVALALGMAGCNSRVPDQTSSPPSGQATAGNEQPAQETSAAELERVKESLAKLSPDDAASAEKQRVCPVTGELLGSMGPPQKVDVDGETVWICCDGCREELLENADKYLAKFKKG